MYALKTFLTSHKLYNNISFCLTLMHVTNLFSHWMRKLERKTNIIAKE